MRATIEVRQESSRPYKTKKGEDRTARSYIGLEVGKDATLLNFVEVDLGEGDAAYSGKLAGKVVTVGVTGCSPGFGGRIRLSGNIVSVA